MDMHPKPLSTHVARRQKQKRQKVIEKQRQKELKRQRELAKCENMTESELRKLRQSDSKAQSRQKLKVCFQRNHVEMVSLRVAGVACGMLCPAMQCNGMEWSKTDILAKGSEPLGEAISNLVPS
mmetsp:Transcript_9634/g.26222  ORF Transcript_9634/g.26222 Transcript_9634/m.26222 type:complete len:124 (+) Transcript_9634:1938-2309(+)